MLPMLVHLHLEHGQEFKCSSNFAVFFKLRDLIMEQKKFYMFNLETVS